MVSFDENPYLDCEGGDNVTTSVVALELQQSNGDTVSLRDLEKEIDIRIRQPEHPFDSDNENFILRVNGTSSQFHTFNHTLGKAAVAVEFLSESGNVLEWKIMVAREKRPSVQENLASWSINGKERKLFLLESRLLKEEGTYHIKVQSITMLHSGSPGNNNVFNASYSLKISTLRCFFWSETTESWSSAGCRVSVIIERLLNSFGQVFYLFNLKLQ